MVWRSFRSLLAALALAAALLLAGCGTAEMNVHITVTDDDLMQLEVQLRGTGLIMEALLEGMAADELRQEGWEVTRQQTDAGLEQTARLEAPLGGQQAAAEMGGLSGAMITKQPGLFWDDYQFLLEMEPTVDPEALAGDDSGYSVDELSAMLDSSLRVSFAVTLPGKLTGSNGDQITEDTATWHLSVAELSRAYRLEAQSRRYLPYRMAAAGAAALAALGGLAGGAIWLLVRSRRARLATASAPAAPMDEGGPSEG
jgi:hypothetical protein